MHGDALLARRNTRIEISKQAFTVAKQQDPIPSLFRATLKEPTKMTDSTKKRRSSIAQDPSDIDIVGKSHQMSVKVRKRSNERQRHDFKRPSGTPMSHEAVQTVEADLRHTKAHSHHGDIRCSPRRQTPSERRSTINNSVLMLSRDSANYQNRENAKVRIPLYRGDDLTELTQHDKSDTDGASFHGTRLQHHLTSATPEP